MENWIMSFVSVLASGCYFYFAAVRKKSKSLQLLWKENRYEIGMACIFLLGFLSRVLFLRTMPAGLNQDEASIGYEAYAILHEGIDRNGVAFPVHLIAWGSGQNALYAYLAMPFIGILDLNEFSLRLPMALIGCAALWAFYQLLRHMTGKRETMLGTLLFAVMPWHIMKSRWALESNLFPDMILFFSVLLLLGIQTHKKRYFWFSFAVLGLSVYSYGTAYFFVPLLLAGTIVFLLIRKKITFWEILGPIIMLLILVLPMVLFVAVNTFDMEQFKLGWITVPKLYVSRHTEKSAVFSGDFLHTFWENLKLSLQITETGSDDLLWNSFSPYGMFYSFSLFFLVVGVVCCCRKTEWIREKWIMNVWGIISFFMMGIVEPNINRLNVIWIPAIFYIAVGLIACVRNSKLLMKTAAAIYFSAFLLFTHSYTTTYQEEIGGKFFASLGEALTDAIDRNAETVYVSGEINQPYIFALFYSQTSPKTYRDTVQYSSQYTAFEQINSFDGFVFYIPEELNDPNGVYIMPNYQAESLDQSQYQVTSYANYSVVQMRIA